DHDHDHDHEHHHDNDHDHDHDHDHEHHHHHDHDADEVFTSWGVESPKQFTEDEIASVLAKFAAGNDYGMVLRAKGIVPAADGGWLHFDYVPGEPDIRRGAAGVTGRLCVIGAELKEHEIKELFGV
ncbi:MAG: GTP-binding protein, partial [Oscillospiraceae bacterium]|nr:GTP-binding protein [Oscillospiraceae bacterium]